MYVYFLQQKAIVFCELCASSWGCLYCHYSRCLWWSGPLMMEPVVSGMLGTRSLVHEYMPQSRQML